LNDIMTGESKWAVCRPTQRERARMAMRSETVTAAIIMREGKVLIGQRHRNSSYPGSWEFPGGKMEAGETPEECMARELLEEMDIRVVVGERLAQVSHTYPDITIELIALKCEFSEDEISDIGCETHAWVAPNELSEYDLLPPDREIAAVLFKEVEEEGRLSQDLF